MPGTSAPKSIESPEVIAVTIGIGDIFRYLAELAAATCRGRTGLATYILGAGDMLSAGCNKPHELKFALFELFPRAQYILYFDADTIFLEDWNVPVEQAAESFFCVRDFADDPSVIAESLRIGINPKSYFNSGLFLLSRSAHRDMLTLAGRLSREFPSPFHDQTYLNAARSELQIATIFLGPEYNAMRLERRQDLPRATVGHFRWIDSKPIDMLGSYYHFWLRRGIGRLSEIQQCVDELLGMPYTINEVGLPSRQIAFHKSCKISLSAADSEKYWEISLQSDGPVLWISNDRSTTHMLRRTGEGIWKGTVLADSGRTVSIDPLMAAASEVPGHSNSKME